MIHVDFDPAKLEGEERTWWEAWVARAQLATKACVEEVEAGRPPKWREDVWGDLKTFLLQRVFHGKCAYCESRVGHTSFGDAEHFCPKGAVKIRSGGKQRSVQCGGADHPGYYWLAHDWRNLIPACQQCNTVGKGNQFTVAGSYVCDPTVGKDPDDLDLLEQPLLLHPYRDRPDEHLRFGVRGAVTARNGDSRGTESISVYGLKRPDLVVDRSDYQEKAWDKAYRALGSGEAQLRRVIRGLREGRSPHSAAAWEYVKVRLERLGGLVGET
jgi:hypothetical protein